MRKKNKNKKSEREYMEIDRKMRTYTDGKRELTSWDLQNSMPTPWLPSISYSWKTYPFATEFSVNFTIFNPFYANLIEFKCRGPTDKRIDGPTDEPPDRRNEI